MWSLNVIYVWQIWDRGGDIEENMAEQRGVKGDPIRFSNEKWSRLICVFKGCVQVKKILFWPTHDIGYVWYLYIGIHVHWI